ncbi:MAG: SGNH/GDSL hydrolase family protein [Promicromonosporaceae bacterium]|nr:SGNH/GDSL hydrolase family protein [Promicromonosporaceae bacterium]
MPERRALAARHAEILAAAFAVLVVVASFVAGTGPTRPAAPPAGATPLTVVALGDSVPSATTCGCIGYVDLLAGRLGALTRRTPVVHNDATGGWTTADVVEDLGSGATRSDLRHADLVVVEIGANDFDLHRIEDPSCYPAPTSGCWDTTLAGLTSGLTRIVRTVRSVDVEPHARVAVIGYWNITVDGAVGRSRGQAFVAGSDALTRTVNASIQSVATATGATYVDAYTPLKGITGTRDPTDDLLGDGDHPNQAGHRLIAQAVLSVLVREGAVAAWQADGEPPALR